MAERGDQFWPASRRSPASRFQAPGAASDVSQTKGQCPGGHTGADVNRIIGEKHRDAAVRVKSAQQLTERQRAQHSQCGSDRQECTKSHHLKPQTAQSTEAGRLVRRPGHGRFRRSARLQVLVMLLGPPRRKLRRTPPSCKQVGRQYDRADSFFRRSGNRVRRRKRAKRKKARALSAEKKGDRAAERPCAAGQRAASPGSERMSGQRGDRHGRPERAKRSRGHAAADGAA